MYYVITAVVALITGTFLGFLLAALMTAAQTSDALPSEEPGKLPEEITGATRLSYFNTNFWPTVHEFFPSVRASVYMKWVKEFLKDTTNEDFLGYLCTNLSRYEGIDKSDIEYVFLKNNRLYDFFDYYYEKYFPVFQKEFPEADKITFEQLLREYVAGEDAGGYTFAPFRVIWRAKIDDPIR